MTVIAGVQGELGDHTYPQAQISSTFAELVSPGGEHNAVIERIHRGTVIEFRHLALPLENYKTLNDFGQSNDHFIEVGLDLAERAVTGALAHAGLNASDVDLIVSTSVTGIAAPSLESRLFPRVGFRPDTKRIPIFGLGCVAGVAGISRVHDYLVGHPDGVAILLSVELCSLTLQRNDTSMPNIVACGLFGDGAAAVVLVGDDRAQRLGITGPTVVASASRMYPDTERTMGWDIGSSGFRIVLSANVAEVINQYLRDDIESFLGDHDLKIPDITTWVSHPGGPRVLEAIEESLGLAGGDQGDLGVTWKSLKAIGNLSSASVLHVLHDTLKEKPAGSGEPALMMAMGPGFCSEAVLLQW